MIARLMLLVAFVTLGSVSLSACNTIQGAGKDVSAAGNKVQEEAAEHKHY